MGRTEPKSNTRRSYLIRNTKLLKTVVVSVLISLISKAGFQPQHAQTVWSLTTDDLAYLNDASDHHMIFIDLDITSPSKPSIDINDGGNTIDVTIEAGVPEESNASAATPVVGRAAIAAVITMMSAALLL